MNVRDRIIELRRVRACDLVPHPKNWRTHPESQRDAMRGVLAEIGHAGAALAYETGGRLVIIDGHMRQGLDPNAEIPVLVLDVNDAEAEKLLLAFDPISAMAGRDNEKLDELLRGNSTEESGLRQLLADLAYEVERAREADVTSELGDVPGMALEPHEHYDYLVVLARNTHEWNVLCDKLGLQPMKRRGRMGTARGIRCDALLEKLNGTA